MTFREAYKKYFDTGMRARELLTVPVTPESQEAEAAFWRAQAEFCAAAVRVAKGEAGVDD